MESEQKSASYNLLVASIREAVNDTVNHNYSENDLESLSKPELIAIIIQLQNEVKLIKEKHNTPRKTKKKYTNSPPHSASPATLDPSPDGTSFLSENKPRMKAKERNATDYDKIQQKREEIRALKEKKRQEKLNAENMLKQRNMHRKFNHNPHEKMRAVIKATEKMGTDYVKIEKQREKIRALKEKQKKAKLENTNALKHRNMHRTNNLFSDPHEKIVKVKEIKQPKTKKKNTGNNKDKVVDPVNRDIMQQREEIQEEVEHIHNIHQIHEEIQQLNEEQPNEEINL